MRKLTGVGLSHIPMDTWTASKSCVPTIPLPSKLPPQLHLLDTCPVSYLRFWEEFPGGSVGKRSGIVTAIAQVWYLSRKLSGAVVWPKKKEKEKEKQKAWEKPVFSSLNPQHGTLGHNDPVTHAWKAFNLFPELLADRKHLLFLRSLCSELWF